VHALENSLLSFSLAGARFPSLDFVELDVQLTRDGVPIVHHDWTVLVQAQSCTPSPLVSLRVPLSALTFAQLSALAPQPLAYSRELGALAHCLGAPEVADEGAWALASLGHMQQGGNGEGDGGGAVHGAKGAWGAGGAAAGAGGGGAPLRADSAFSAQAVGAARLAHQRTTARALDALGVDRHTEPASGRLARGELRDGLGLRCGAFPSLRTVLASLRPAMGLNIELKYPSDAEVALHGLQPPTREVYWEAVWAAVQQGQQAQEQRQGAHRPLLFSSFDPSLCELAKARQSQYPVAFLTMGGLEACKDPRCCSFDAALSFAEGAKLLGVVAHCDSLAPSVEQAVGRAREKGLIVGTFGRSNNIPRVALEQVESGVGLVILDHLALLATLAPRHQGATTGE
jgi:glycerophosphoryl diester phosphodiesterase